jgi:hypothetical protein
MARKKESYRVGGPSLDQKREKSPYSCKWWELVTDKAGSREVPRSRWFPSLDAAKAFGESIRVNSDVRSLTDQERLQYLYFIKECEARHIKLHDVFTAGLRHYNAEVVSDMTMKEAVELFCIYMTGEHYSGKTIAGYEGSLVWFMRETGESRKVASFTAQELIDVVKHRYDKHTSQQAFLRDLKSFFSWAARNNHCSASVSRDAMLNPNNTKSSVRKSAQRRTHKKPPRLTVDQIKTCFEVVESRYHPALALAVFAGLRPESEVPHIEWAMTDKGQPYGIIFENRTIRMHESWVTKTFMERNLHDLPDPLWKILELHRKESGKISVCNYANWRKSVLKPIKDALGMDILPNDIFRHTALSFQYTLIGKEVAMNNAGHLNSRTFDTHYLNSVGLAEAKAFRELDL